MSLARLVDQQRRLTGMWLFVKGRSCPSPLSGAFQELLASIPAATLLDLCVSDYPYAVASLVRVDVFPMTQLYFTRDVFLPSVRLWFDEEPTTRWRIEATPNGNLFSVELDSYWGHRFMRLTWDRLTACELERLP